MAHMRKIRIEYYLVVYTKKNTNDKIDKLFDLEKVLQVADRLKLEERTFNYYQEKARLDQLLFDGNNDYWYLNFLRLRQTKIPSKAKKDAIAEPIKLAIDEYIGEDVTALYDIKNHILALQRNRDSLSSTGIEYYLNELYKSDTEEIHLKPISPKDIDNRISKAKIFRKITIRFAALPKGINNQSSLGGFIRSFKKYSANTAVLTLSVGHSKKGSLNQSTIKDIIDEIRENQGVISSAELSIKNSDVDPVDLIDIISMKSHDFIIIKVENLQTISFNQIAGEILTRYNKSKDRLLNALKLE